MSRIVRWLRYQWDRFGDWRDNRRRGPYGSPDDPGNGMV